MIPRRDYYRLLGIEPDADNDAIKRAYRTLVRSLHPDHNPSPGAGEQFRLVKEAYEVLGHRTRRAAYDRDRMAVFRMLADAPASNLGSFIKDSLDRPPHAPNTASRRVRVSISFDEALRGGHREVQTPDGELVRVTVPRGACDRLTMRVRGKGGTRANSETSARGDLYVEFEVRPHPRFRREGLHLHTVETITAVEAMLGTSRTIENAYGTAIRVTIPPGTQPGERLRIRGQGVATSIEKGDLFVEIDVQVPKELSDEQRAQLLRAVRDLGLM